LESTLSLLFFDKIYRNEYKPTASLLNCTGISDAASDGDEPMIAS